MKRFDISGTTMEWYFKEGGDGSSGQEKQC